MKTRLPAALIAIVFAIGLGFVAGSSSNAFAAVRECSAFQPNKNHEYLQCPSRVYIRHANGVEDWNIRDGEVVTLVGRKLPANTDIYFQVACQGYYQEPAHSDVNGVATFAGCMAVVDPSPGAENCAFIYYVSPVDNSFHTIAYSELVAY